MMLLELGKKKRIGERFGLTSQGVSQILAGKRPTSPNNKLVKAAAYEDGGLVRMSTSFDSNGNMICSWSDGAVKLLVSKATGATYKYVCGEQVDSWQGLDIPDFGKIQKECERFAAINF